MFLFQFDWLDYWSFVGTAIVAVMETDDTCDLEQNTELRHLISGTFDEPNDTVTENGLDSQTEQSELPEHRFVEKDSRTTLYIEDYIFRRRYIRKDSATFTCTGCEKISRREGKTGRKKDASAVALITSEGYVLQVADSDEEHKCWLQVLMWSPRKPEKKCLPE